MPKPTMSQDDIYRIDLRITRRVSVSEMAAYFAASLDHIGEPERLQEVAQGLTAKQIRDMTRDEMERRGTDYIDGWADRFSYDETTERLALAADQIRRAYPELAEAEGSQRPKGRYVVQLSEDNRNAVVDTTTGEQVYSSWSRYPVNVMADGLNDGSMVVDSTGAIISAPSSS